MMDQMEWIITIVKPLVVVGLLLTVVPLMVWVERRGSALMQNRLGPNRLGPLGLFQSIADVLKFVGKEDRTAEHVVPFFYRLAPIICLVPSIMTFAVMPFAAPLVWDGRTIVFQAANMDVGLLYILSVGSLGVFGIIMAGWASNSKYALLGSLRSSSQMISYELSMGLSIIGIIMAFSSVQLGEIAVAQGQALLQLGPLVIPKWGVFIQPLGFIIFITSVYAETNRLPFDLPEGESEIVAGYHIEYGGMTFATFFMAEYLNMTTASAFIATLYFGGFQMLPGLSFIHEALGFSGMAHEWARVGFQAVSFLIKVGFFLWLFVWVRWTLPRFRYDQLMDLGWKIMLPLSLANVVITAALIYYKVL